MSRVCTIWVRWLEREHLRVDQNICGDCKSFAGDHVLGNLKAMQV